jgi:outer membrane protein assembly factor BamB
MRLSDNVRNIALVAALGSLGAVSAVGALAAFSACASDEPGTPAPLPVEAGSDAPLLGETSVPDAGADIPLGDVCGDAKGLENDAPWPMRGGCPKRAGVASGAGPQNATLKWSLPLAAGESSPAIAADRLLWVGTTDGDVVVLSPSGVVQAALHTGGAVKSSPVRSASGLSVIGSTDGTLYGVDRFGETGDAGTDAEAGTVDDAGDDGGSDGGNDGGVIVGPARAVFSRPLSAILSSPAIGGDGTIYVSTTAGKLVAVAADGSAVKWSATTNDTLGSSPSIAKDGTIYIGSSDHKLYAFTPQGAMKWLFDAGAAISGSPVVGGDDTIYVGATDGKLYAVTPDGKQRWVYAAGGAITGAPCVRAGVVYVGSDDKKLHAVATPTGAGKWTFDTLGAVATPVVGVDGTVYVGSADGKLYAVTPTGLLFFAVNVKGRIHSAPAVGDDGTLYVTTDTALVAIGP